MNADTYREDLLMLVESFEYELCECGGDIDTHIIGPDVLGNPHLYCTLEDTT